MVKNHVLYKLLREKIQRLNEAGIVKHEIDFSKGFTSL